MESKLKLHSLRVIMNDNPKQLFEAIKWVKALKLGINDIVDDAIEGSYIIYLSDKRIDEKVEYFQVIANDEINIYTLLEQESEDEKWNREWCEKNFKKGGSGELHVSGINLNIAK